jgi:Rieske 2Fe-2S family protein
MTAQIADDDGYNGLGSVEETLPSHAYFDAAHYQRELDSIWYRNWVYLCRAKSLETPRSYRTFDLGSQQILLLRDEAGGLRAFHNTCRHRGSRLCRAEAGRFDAKRIVCPYHRWAYSLEGALLRTSSLAAPEGFDPSDYPLYDLAVAEWGGFVFVNLAGDDGLSVEGSFDRASERLGHWPLEDLIVGHSYRKILECNWKVFWDNFNECLHCPGVHPELSSLVPLYGRGIIAERDDPHWREHADSDDPRFKGGLRRGGATWSMDGQAQGATFQGLSDQERRAGQTFVTSLPSAYMVGHVDYVRVVRLLPLGPERTELVALWLFPPEALAEAAFNPAEVAEFATLVMEQDAEACELNQRGLHALRHDKGVLMPEEYYVKWFHDWVRAQMAPGATAQAADAEA